MKRFLENLLIVVSVALCVLIAYQWKRESGYREDIEALTKSGKEKDVQIAGLQSTGQKLERQVDALLNQNTNLFTTVKDQEAQLKRLQRDLKKFEFDNENLKERVTNLLEVVEERTAKLVEQQKRINEVITDRNEMVKERNEMVEKSNDIIKKYNDLVAQFDKYQKDAQAAISNAVNNARPAK